MMIVEVVTAAVRDYGKISLTSKGHKRRPEYNGVSINQMFRIISIG